MTSQYPTIIRRYFSSLFDGIILIVIFIISLSLVEGKDQITSTIRFFLPLAFMFFYEPLLTSKACTFGQLITGIRVRKINDLNKISIFSAYVRYFVKLFLGFISFFTILFTDKNRAIHDFISGTVVIQN